MRGRTPQPLTVARADVPVLEHPARSQAAPWYQVRRARTVLAVAAGRRTSAVAAQVQCDVDTVRRTCRLYAARGLPGRLARPVRPGRPARLSPPGVRPDRPARLPGADRPGLTHHPLVQCRPGPPGRGRRHRP